MAVMMHGPAFDGSGDLVERQVPDMDVVAFEAAGYKRGPLPPAEAAAESTDPPKEPAPAKKKK